MKYIIIIGALFFTATSGACTTFLLCKKGEIVFGRNYDWIAESGMLCTNQRRLLKTSFKKNDGEIIQWVSKYGSITFNQYGKEFPIGGMNEEGLVVELMWLDGSKYPKPDKRASVSNLQWIQYQLDNCATIDEVIATDKIIRISKNDSPLHYLIADASGKAATIEFLNGKLVVHKNESLPFPVLTNNNYKYSVSKTNELIQEKETDFSFQGNSLRRFATACTMLKDFKEYDGNSINYAFNILNEVKQGAFTKWSIVYDIKNKTVYFKTLSNSKLKYLNIDSLDFSCDTKPKAYSLDDNKKGDIKNELKPFTFELNKNILESTIRQSKKRIKPNEEYKKRRLNYINSIKCDSKK